mmetsp:Transcript_17735/g.30022  ORF Transcript_17735/g.30022 Transcript_17735/m.30022 type:complete len:199 (-) Transcript_17735:2241-2837(-)
MLRSGNIDPNQFTYRDGVNYKRDLAVESSQFRQTLEGSGAGFGFNGVEGEPDLSLEQKFKLGILQMREESGGRNIPLPILAKFWHRLRLRGSCWISVAELEQIWEVYRSMLIEQAEKEIFKEEARMVESQLDLGQHSQDQRVSSNMNRMVSTKKLLKEGRMFMTQPEIQAVQSGRLREYLDQFIFDEEASANSVSDLD